MILIFQNGGNESNDTSLVTKTGNLNVKSKTKPEVAEISDFPLKYYQGGRRSQS